MFLFAGSQSSYYFIWLHLAGGDVCKEPGRIQSHEVWGFVYRHIVCLLSPGPAIICFILWQVAGSDVSQESGRIHSHEEPHYESSRSCTGSVTYIAKFRKNSEIPLPPPHTHTHTLTHTQNAVIILKFEHCELKYSNADRMANTGPYAEGVSGVQLHPL